MALKPSASRLLIVWWCVLHALLVAAALLVAVPSIVRLAALAAIAAHAVVRRPRATPPLLFVGSDAACLVPQWGTSPAPLGPRTVVCTHWIRLDVATGSRRRDIVLLIDQLGPGEWARLRALLDRARCDTAHVMPHPREPI